MEPDQPQRDRPVAYVIAQQYSPAIRALIPAKNFFFGGGGHLKIYFFYFSLFKRLA